MIQIIAGQNNRFSYQTSLKYGAFVSGEDARMILTV